MRRERMSIERLATAAHAAGYAMALEEDEAATAREANRSVTVTTGTAGSSAQPAAASRTWSAVAAPALMTGWRLWPASPPVRPA